MRMPAFLKKRKGRALYAAAVATMRDAGGFEAERLKDAPDPHGELLRMTTAAAQFALAQEFPRAVYATVSQGRVAYALAPASARDLKRTAERLLSATSASMTAQYGDLHTEIGDPFVMVPFSLRVRCFGSASEAVTALFEENPTVAIPTSKASPLQAAPVAPPYEGALGEASDAIARTESRT